GVPRRGRLARADELLDRVDMADKRDRTPGRLSGGEQQRVAVCAALAHRPRLFLADEPTGELDHANADLVYRLIGELTREAGTTAVVVSHDPESAVIADRIVRIRDGRVSEEWTRTDSSGDTIVIGRGGWLRLPEELLARAGIGDRATARFHDEGIVVSAVDGPADAAEELPAMPRGAPAPSVPDEPVVAEARGIDKAFGLNPVLAGVSA